MSAKASQTPTQQGLSENSTGYMNRVNKQFQITQRNLQGNAIQEGTQERDEPGVGIKAISQIKEILPIQLTWLDCTFTINVGKKKKERVLLNKVSGSVESGRILAVMGPSGCGKTTLLNALSGRLPRGGVLQGQIKVNGLPVTDGFKTVTAYVTQDDTLHATLSVEETLQISAALRTAQHVSKSDKKNIVDSVIQELGLSKARNTQIGNAFIRGVSGGERKRANIGVEMIANPSVLFLDEPTSGLDSFQAQSVVTTMWNLAKNGRTVVTVIHQPRSSIYRMFDQLILMSSGNTIFYGQANEALDYFSKLGFACPQNYNPSDFFSDLISVDNRSKEVSKNSQERVDLLIDAYRNYNINRTRTNLDVSNRRITDSTTINLDKQKFDEGLQRKTQDMLKMKLKRNTNQISQFAILFWRQSRLSGREVKPYMLSFLQFIVLAVIGGLTYLKIAHNKTQAKINDTIGACFLLVLQMTFFLVSNTLVVYPTARKFMDKERASKAYNILPYMVAINCFEIPYRSAPAVLLIILFYLFFDFQRTAYKFFYYIGLNALYLTTMSSFALMIGSAFSSLEAANGISVLQLIIYTVFAGLYIKESSLTRGAAWVKYITPLRFAFYGNAYNEFQGQVGYQCTQGVNTIGTCSSCITTGDEVLQSLQIFSVGDQFHTTTRAYVIVGLIYLFFAYQIITYIVLRFLTKPRFASLSQKKVQKESKKVFSNPFLKNT